MDRIDREILFALYNNCRTPYQNLAKKHGLTVSAVWRRVQQLQKKGIIDHFALELSPDRIEIYQMLIIVAVDGTVDEQVLVKNLSEIDFIISISAITNRTGIVILEAPNGDSLDQAAQQIELSQGISSVDIYRIGSWLEAWEGAIGSANTIPSFPPEHIKLLRLLYTNPRISLSELSKQLDYSHRRVKRTLDDIISSQSVWFTVRLSVRTMNALFKITYTNESSPAKIIHRFESNFPDKYMWTFSDEERKSVFSQFFVNSPDDADMIRSQIRDVEGIEIVETFFHRASLKLTRYRAKMLEEMIRESSTH